MAENFESGKRETVEDFDENRSVFRYFKNLKQIFEKYSDENHVSDIVDMETLEVITDNGDLADRQKTRFGYSTLAITKKDSEGKIDEREYEEFLRDPDSFISPPNLPADPLRVKTETNEAFNKTYIVNTLNQRSARLHKDVDEDALCRLEETHVEVIDSTSSDESSDYLSDNLDTSSSSSSSGDDLFLYKNKTSSGKLGDPRNTTPNRNVVQSRKSPRHWNALRRSPWKAKDKSSHSHSQKSPGIFKNQRSVNAKSRNGRQLGRIPADHRQCEKPLLLTPNIPDKFEFDNHFECDDEKENLLGKDLRGGQHSYSVNTTESSHGDSSDTGDLNIKPSNTFHIPDRQFQQRPANLKPPLVATTVNAVEKGKRRITPSLVGPLSDHHMPSNVGPTSRPECVVGNPESPSVSMTRSLNCLTLEHHNNIHQTSDKPLDLSKNTSSWNCQNPYPETSKPRVEGEKVLEPKRLNERFTGCYLTPRVVEDQVSLLSEGSSEEMEDTSKNSPSDDEESNSAKSPPPLAASHAPTEDVKESIDDHPFLKPLITEFLSNQPPVAKLARNVELGSRQPSVKSKVGASPHGRLHGQPRTNQRGPFVSPVAFFKVMQKKNKQSPVACQKVLRPSSTTQKVLYSSSINSSDTKQSVVRNDHRESTRETKASTDIQGMPAGHQKKLKPATTAQNIYSSGVSGSKAKQSQDENDFQESSAVYQKKIKPGTAAQKMMYSSGDSGGEARESLGRHDYQASPKHAKDRADHQGSPAAYQKKSKPGTTAEKMLYSSGDSSSEVKQPPGRIGYRASPKQSIARVNIQGFPAAYLQKHKSSTTAQKMLCLSGGSGSEAKQSLGRNDYRTSPKHAKDRADNQGSPVVYQKELKPGTAPQKVLYSSAESGSEVKQSLDRHDLQESPAVYQKTPKPGTTAEKMLYSSGDSGSEASQSPDRIGYRASPKQSIARADIQGSPAAYLKKHKSSTTAQKMLCSSGDSGSEAKQSLGRNDYRASPKHAKDRVDIQGPPAAYQKKPKPGRTAEKMLYSSGDSSSEVKQSRGRHGYHTSPKHSLVNDLPKPTHNPSTKESTPPHADQKVVQATTTATTSTPAKGHNLPKMALDISCIPTNVTTLTDGQTSHRGTSTGGNIQSGVHTTQQREGFTDLASCENVPANQHSVRQKDVRVKNIREGSVEHRLSSPTVKETPGYRRDEPTSKLGTDDTMEHDLRSTSDSDSDDETFTVLSPQPKMFSSRAHFSSFSHVSPLQKQVREKVAQREHKKSVSSAARSSPAASRQRLHTPKRRTYDADSDSDSSNDTACVSVKTPKSERPVNDRLSDSRNPTKHASSEPRRFFPNKKLTPSPWRFKEKSKSAVKSPRASKQQYSRTTSKVATPSPSAQKNLSQKSHFNWNWSFNKKPIDPYAKQLDVYELDSESCDSDIDAPTDQHHDVVAVQRKSKTGTKPMAVFSPQTVHSKAYGEKARLSSHKKVSRIVDSSSDEQSNDMRPLLDSRSESDMTNSSMCLGPGKCDKTFCFTCV